MVLEGKKFIEIYEGFGHNINGILTPYFKSYADNIAENHIFKTAIITGYIMRLIEEKCIEEKIIKSPMTNKLSKEVEIILKKNSTKKQKVEELVNFFDKHNEIGLGKPVKQYTIFPYKETKYYFGFLVEDYINATFKNGVKDKIDQETYYEVIFRNAAIGYYYRVAENLVL